MEIKVHIQKKTGVAVCLFSGSSWFCFFLICFEPFALCHHMFFFNFMCLNCHVSEIRTEPIFVIGDDASGLRAIRLSLCVYGFRSHENQANVIRAFSLSSCSDDLLNIAHEYFKH